MTDLQILCRMAVVLLGTVALMSGAAARDGMRVAIVEDYAGERDKITLQHNGEPVELALGTELVDGDTISVSGDGYAVLRFNDGSQHVDAANSPFAVSGQSGVLDDMSANFGRVLSVIAWWDESNSDEPMRSRDGVPPVLAALERVADPKILAGSRALQLVWVDGKGPFHVSLYHNGTSVASAMTPVGIRSAGMAAELVAGQTYLLTIADLGREASRPTRYEISAVAALPATSVAVPEGDELQPLLAIAELASYNRGSWAFEALQQLYAIEDASRFRGSLIRAIEHGDHP